ncbi:MAG: response regulator [Planctomycetota bacterium]
MTRVLIVDDAAFMRQLIRDALEPLGFEIVAEAGNGRDALERYRELRPDLITLDIVMPEMDGLSTLEAIRAEDHQTPVIMVTAVDQRDSMLRAMRLGIADFVVKPFDEDRIVSAVDKAVGRREA